MRIERIQVEARKSIMLSATGDIAFSVKLEAVLTPEEGSSAEYVQKVTQYLQQNVNSLVEQEIQKIKRG